MYIKRPRVFAAMILKQPASHRWPLSTGQRNAICIAFRWRAYSGPILGAYYEESIPFSI